MSSQSTNQPKTRKAVLISVAAGVACLADATLHRHRTLFLCSKFEFIPMLVPGTVSQNISGQKRHRLTSPNSSGHGPANRRNPLGPFSRAWQWLSLRLSRILGRVVMGVLFFGVLTPAAIMMRWAGKDVLRLRFDPETASYWIPRPSGPDRQTSMTRQF